MYSHSYYWNLYIINIPIGSMVLVYMLTLGIFARHRGQTVALRVPPDRSFDAVGSIAEARHGPKIRGDMGFTTGIWSIDPKIVISPSFIDLPWFTYICHRYVIYHGFDQPHMQPMVLVYLPTWLGHLWGSHVGVHIPAAWFACGYESIW
jgi:hypothetical protein